MPKRPKAGLPSRQQILDFIADSGQPAGKREIGRAFGLSGHDKILLKALLKDMADEGLIDSSPGRAFHKAGGVPRVTVLRVASVDDGGNVWAVLEQWHADTPAPKLRSPAISARLDARSAAAATSAPPAVDVSMTTESGPRKTVAPGVAEIDPASAPPLPILRASTPSSTKRSASAAPSSSVPTAEPRRSSTSLRAPFEVSESIACLTSAARPVVSAWTRT